MEIEIKTFKMVKQEDHKITLPIPEETIYLFETGIRRSICIKPVWTTWQMEQKNQPEEIWKLSVTCVYNDFKAKIESFEVSFSNLDRLYSMKDSSLSKEKDILDLLINGWGNPRTKEQFDADFNTALINIQKHL